MHFKNFTLRALCFDRPPLESGGNMASQWAILTFQAEEEIIFEPLGPLVLRDSVYGGLLNSPCLTRFAWIELRVEWLCRGDDCLRMAAFQIGDSVRRSVWVCKSTVGTNGLITPSVQCRVFTQRCSKWRYFKETTKNKSCVNLFIIIFCILFHVQPIA